MTKREAVAEFMGEIAPRILAHEKTWGGVDHPMRREEWNNFTDYLCKAGKITQKQYDTWVGPAFCN